MSAQAREGNRRITVQHNLHSRMDLALSDFQFQKYSQSRGKRPLYYFGPVMDLDLEMAFYAWSSTNIFNFQYFPKRNCSQSVFPIRKILYGVLSFKPFVFGPKRVRVLRHMHNSETITTC